MQKILLRLEVEVIDDFWKIVTAYYTNGTTETWFRTVNDDMQ